MCHKTKCGKCKKVTWAGCGRHVDYALSGVPVAEVCRCPHKQMKRDCPGCHKPFSAITNGALGAAFAVHFKTSPKCEEPYNKVIEEEGQGCSIM